VTTLQTSKSAPRITDGLPNRLLAALSTDAYERLAPHLTTVPLGFKQVLYKQGEPIHHVYFPGGGIIADQTHAGRPGVRGRHHWQ
jgi:hypothetical protein